MTDDIEPDFLLDEDWDHQADGPAQRLFDADGYPVLMGQPTD